MELAEFLEEFRAEIQAEVNKRMDDPEAEFPFEESIFTEKMLRDMAEWGMTDDDPQVCYFDSPIGNTRMKMNGYAIPERNDSEGNDRLDMFISIYKGEGGPEPVSNQEIVSSAEQCIRMIKRCYTGKVEKETDFAHSDIVDFAMLLRTTYDQFNEIRVFVLTDGVAKNRYFSPRELFGKTIHLEVMDIERFMRLTGNPIDDIIIDFKQSINNSLPCLYVPKKADDYACALTIFPASLLRDLYDKYGARLLEGNVRSYLTAKGKVNRGIESTLVSKPHRFMAYNNGLVLVAEEVTIEKDPEYGFAIAGMKGLQIVNGGQTTATMYFAKKKNSAIDLSSVRVPAKIIILDQQVGVSTEELISEISFCANSQNAVKTSDLSANSPFHRKVEQAFSRLYCPDGESQWFYERASGSYAVMLAREASTKAQLKKLQAKIPTSRKVTKTDLAKYIHAWDCRPVDVADGAQKNFIKFMETTVKSYEEYNVAIDTEWVRNAIGKAIFFKAADRIVAKLQTASKITITTYLVSIFSLKYGAGFNFSRVWNAQGISPQLEQLLSRWAVIVNDIIATSGGGKLMSEWGKNKACWEKVQAGQYPAPEVEIPELV